MFYLPGYKIVEKFYSTGRKSLYRGFSVDGGAPVVIKVLNEEAANPVEVSRLMHEYDIARKLNIDGVVKPLSMIQTDSTFAIILEDTNSISLREYLNNSRLSLNIFLTIAIRLTEILCHLHKNNIIHSDLKPDNILIHPKDMKIYIIDFGNAVYLSSESRKSLAVPSSPAGSLEYMSPEQTGRLNMFIDQRSDLYSLGIIFYEMLTGTLPFQADNPAKWIYAHVTQKPKPVAELNAEIPVPVSNIVMKLLEKNTEHRYQSANGLLSDLKECKVQYDSNGKIAFFHIGKRDILPKLHQTEAIYGREKQRMVLEDAVKSAFEGNNSFILVNGYPGVGKTTLINKTLKPAAAELGFFAAGKFDQLARNIPYAPFADAFGTLIKQLMTESSEKLDWWRKKILQAVGDNGAVIAEVIPELEWIIDKQVPLDPLPPKEAENRFFIMFTKFVNVFSRKKHPLVLFLDDLQWADKPSIDLLMHLCQDRKLNSFLFVGAYRDNEISADHPIMHIFNHQLKIRRLSLTSLTFEDTKRFVAEMLNTQPERVRDLAEDIYRKTGGNPFFIKQLLEHIHQEDLLVFDYDKSSWEWKIDEIKELQPGNDVLELIVKKLQRLPEETFNILKLASCIGNRFDLETLALAYRKSVTETASKLMPAVSAGLVLMLENHTISMANTTLEDLEHNNTMFEFIHDRIHQTVYSPIPEQEKKANHFTIGKLMLDKYEAGNIEDRILLIMDHFNRSLDLVKGNDKRVKLAEYNLMAGQKAKASAAYSSALKYFRAAKELLPENAWTSYYKLSYDLYYELAQMEYVNTNVNVAEDLFGIIIDKARDEMERAGIYGLMISLYAGVGKYTEAVQTGLHALGKLGIKIRLHPTLFDYARQLMLYLWNTRRRSTEDFLQLPEITNPVHRRIAELYSRISNVTMTTCPDLFSYIILKAGNHAAMYGNTEIACVGYLGYAITAGCILRDYAAGEKYANVGIELAQKYNHNPSKSIAYFVFGALIIHWTKHAANSMEYLENAAAFGIKAGDLLTIGYSYSVLIENCLFLGTPLSEIAEIIKEKREIAKRLKHEILIINTAIYKTALLALMQSKGKTLKDGTRMMDSDELSELAGKDKTSSATYYFYKMLLLYMNGEYLKALSVAEQIKPLEAAINGFMISAGYNFYYSLSITAAFKELPFHRQKQYRLALVKNQKMMKKWAKSCPENFEHKYLLVEAEWARLCNRKDEAMTLYEEAIRLAKENRYVNDEAVANELAAKFYLSSGRDRIAALYMLEAYRGYNRWQAYAKAKYLAKRYKRLLETTDHGHRISSTGKTIESLLGVNTPSETDTANSIDKYFLMETIENITNETDKNRLFARFIEIAAKSVGADKAYLIIEKNGELFIEAGIDSSGVASTMMIPIEQYNEISKAVVRYVARTLETVIVDCRNKPGIFVADSYIAETETSSIACVPLLLQGIPYGVLYVENRFIPGIFVSDQLEVLRFLSTHVAYAKKLQSYLEEDLADKETGSPLVEVLTKRETEVLKLIAMGLSNKEIAERLVMTINTVKSHIKNIYGKLQVNRRIQAVQKAKEKNLL